MPMARVIRPKATDTSYLPPNSQHSPSEKFRERTQRIFNKRAAAAVLRDIISIAFVTRPGTREHPPQPDACIDATIYIKLNTTLQVIFVLGWGYFILQYQFNELDDRMSKREKGQIITKKAREPAMEIDGEMSMDSKLIGMFIT